jgi:hypothetical protein
MISLDYGGLLPTRIHLTVLAGRNLAESRTNVIQIIPDSTAFHSGYLADKLSVIEKS